jgi:hypothetical protein
VKIHEIRHPYYSIEEDDWEKYRLVYEGGRKFIDKYLEKYSCRENDADFTIRRKITYAPSFAKSAINEIKNVIFNRLRDVTRYSNSNSYCEAICGKSGGVDNAGSSMDYFIGQYIVPELLTMRRVGVYVDMPRRVPETLIEKRPHPYLYFYTVEDIHSWTYTDPSDEQEFQSILLCENTLKYDYGLPADKYTRFRHVTLLPNNEGIIVKFYNTDSNSINIDGTVEDVAYRLPLKHIPFVMFEIQDSLLKDIADYQIALLNMESADVAYAVQANFTTYIEEKSDGITEIDAIPSLSVEEIDNIDETDIDKKIREAKNISEKVGHTYGKRYPKGANPPAYIHPSAEPLKAAMDKEKQIKKDIKLLINLAITDLSEKMVSEDSKKMDESGKQTGLACVAYVLENGERKIAKYWAAYEKLIEPKILVDYPKDYDLKSDDDRRRDAKELLELLESIPSAEFKRKVLKIVVTTLIGHQTPQDELDKIYKEIDSTNGLMSGIETILQCHEKGLVSDKTASILAGFDASEAEKAATDHAARLARIQEAQGQEGGSARGVPDTQTTQPTSSDEKKGKEKRT